jgi:hypothetical protein
MRYDLEDIIVMLNDATECLEAGLDESVFALIREARDRAESLLDEL